LVKTVGRGGGEKLPPKIKTEWRGRGSGRGRHPKPSGSLSKVKRMFRGRTLWGGESHCGRKGGKKGKGTYSEKEI